jgi:cobalt-zinc-cadmium efflux system outer membrane protein
MKHPLRFAILGAVLLPGVAPLRARAQIVVIDDVILMTSRQKEQRQARTHQHLDPPGGENLLGPSPGADDPRLGEERMPAPALPRVLSTRTARTRRRGRSGSESRLQTPGVANPPSTEMVLPGSLELPAEEEGPADGLTLGAAVDRLLAANTDLSAKFQDIPKARADVLTAGLRSNPFLFVSVSNIPYGSYSPERPGATSYDLTIIQPLDLNGKRRHRIRVAEQAKCVLEAQYQDAVRQEIDKLHTAYLDVLAAREAARAVRAGLARLTALRETARDLAARGLRPRSEVSRVAVKQASVESAVQEAETALLQARRRLAVLLAIPPDGADRIQLRGSLHDRCPPLPCTNELIRIALQTRPDLIAYRLGLDRAEADVRLARAEAFDNVFLFYTPFNATDFSPQGKQSATGWGLGAIFPVPLFDRNQGDIARARANVTQTELEREVLERRIANEVQYATTECELSRAEVEQYEQEILPSARTLRDEKYHLFTQGRESLDALLEIQEDYDEAVRGYLESLVRHRRDMLRLTVVLGQRILS